MLATNDWYSAVIGHILAHGHVVAPRGQRVKEVLNLSLCLDDQRRNIVVNPARRLNYRYLIAEWLWIALGLNDLDLLTRYNSRMAAFSDDGRTLAGAYGPRLKPQWDYVRDALDRDPDTRQAVATIWTPSPRPSKDIPCTVSLQFFLRDGRLHTIANMRSSDAWLGLPYDVFTFGQLSNALAGDLGVPTGKLMLNLASSHLYEQHWEAGRAVLNAPTEYVWSPPLTGLPPRWVENALRITPVSAAGAREPWRRYLTALTADHPLAVLRQADLADVA